MFYLSDYKNIGHNKEDRSDGGGRYKNSERDVNGVRHQGKLNSSFEYICELLDEYLKFSSLHGLRYIRDPSIPRVERLFWLGIFLVCLYISGIVVWDTYQAGIADEFQLIYDPRSTPIWQIPFPAVLVCSVHPIRKSVFDIDKQVDNVKFRHFSKLVCSNKEGFDSEVFNSTIDEEFFKFIINAAIPCHSFIVNCYFQGKRKDCCILFKPIITNSGVCYVFNSLPGEAMFKYYTPVPGFEVVYDENMLFWDIEKGYPQQKVRDEKVRPFWVNSRGPLTALTFDLVNVRGEVQETCSGSRSGFKVYIYPPDGFFDVESSIRIPSNVHSHIKVNPKLITAEENIRTVDVDKRKCLFKDELRLEYFDYYSQGACQIELFTKTALQLCGCIPFMLHRVVGKFGYQYCKDMNSTCIFTVFENLIDESMKNSKEQLHSWKHTICFPGCFWLTYDIDKSFQKLVPTNVQPVLGNYNKRSQLDVARLSFYYHDDQFNSVKRVKISDLGDVLGNCGGLLGLLLGFSFMSFFEVIYFAIFRPLRKIFSFFVTSEE